MPIFEYRCQDCGAKFEQITQSANPEIVCKTCLSTQVEKLLSVFAVSGSARESFGGEPGPCGACGAPRRGMCGE